DATGDKPGIVVCEVPAKPPWCEIRNTVFSWTRTRFSFHTGSAKKLNITDPPIITVTGKAFFDVGHSLKDQKSNRRSHLPGYAAWEIHPVIKLEVHAHENAPAVPEKEDKASQRLHVLYELSAR